MEAYFTSVLLPSANGQMSLRNRNEMRTLAKLIDLILEGKVTEAAEHVMLRFQAVEMAHHDGHWNVARHLTPLPAGVSSSSWGQRAALLRDEERDVRARTMAAAARRPGGGPH